MLMLSPAGVGVTILRTASTMPLAADAADDEPRAAMIAAPRFCTLGMNSSLSQASSLMTSAADLPPICAE